MSTLAIPQLWIPRTRRVVPRRRYHWLRRLIGLGVIAGEAWVNEDGEQLLDDDGKLYVCDDCPCGDEPVSPCDPAAAFAVDLSGVASCGPCRPTGLSSEGVAYHFDANFSYDPNGSWGGFTYGDYFCNNAGGDCAWYTTVPRILSGDVWHDPQCQDNHRPASTYCYTELGFALQGSMDNPQHADRVVALWMHELAGTWMLGTTVSRAIYFALFAYKYGGPWGYAPYRLGDAIPNTLTGCNGNGFIGGACRNLRAHCNLWVSGTHASRAGRGGTATVNRV